MSDKVSLEIADITIYEEMAKKRVLNVPKIVLNDKYEISSSFPPTIILKMLVKGSEQH